MHIEFTVAVIVAAPITIGIIWLCFGRQISQWLDRLYPGRAIPKSIDPMLLSPGNFSLGSLNWAFPGPEESDLKFAPDRQNRLVLYAEGSSFILGPIQKMWNDPIKPQYQFTPEPGDIVSFTRDISRLPWPTPFTFNILGAPVPKWKRYAYDRLRWSKPGGSKLEITWRDEYWFYRRKGWKDVYINRWAGIRIHPAPTRMTESREAI
ncbi:MAG TPA: hypothetical protein VGG44_11185 [Tepidisphaeraceae bacterium]|jgi:hypothetical protein